ncbi:hypothetical protein SEPL_096 [Salmonella phage SE_PL]|uniref:hypothetical protein n=1 Tax=Salmonella enterica TaxID=28901 RepID=UPI000FDF7C31|nr:hypothetical protein CPT_Munch_331 [Salmonella phage Munch]EAZ2022625.1 hypothetical protein [Salmonella enterica]ECV9083759.1 hypothetical protein [Salmonella enterica subsp. enterica serovar Infantis]MCP0435650.1 hypothetical protein [Salmonella enterica subsp. enterica serovar Mbandaka]QCW19028.1 hypothetical protein 7t3_0508 [Salmonella phage 7t3]QIG62709.1 hypothetical protein SEPL_096 [Salmonella phage SE_PL]WNV47438.1 hypothetical protein [Klebsiella phage fENko-Kae01]
MSDVFSFMRDVEYVIVLEGSIQLTGMVEETYDNGIQLHDGTCIPQDKILFFKANLGTNPE